MKKITFLCAVLTMLLSTVSFAQERCKHNQDGCWEIVVLNAVWDPSNEVTKGMDQPVVSLEEISERAFTKGAAVFKEMETGRLMPSNSRSFTVFFWDVDSFTTVVTRHLVKKGNTVMGVDAMDAVDIIASTTDFIFDESVEELGQPSRAFRVTVPEGSLGVSLQLPWSMIGTDAYIVICPDYDDTKVVYPRDTDDTMLGLWVSKDTIAYLKERKSRGDIAPILSNL